MPKILVSVYRANNTWHTICMAILSMWGVVTSFSSAVAVAVAVAVVRSIE